MHNAFLWACYMNFSPLQYNPFLHMDRKLWSADRHLLCDSKPVSHEIKDLNKKEWHAPVGKSIEGVAGINVSVTLSSIAFSLTTACWAGVILGLCLNPTSLEVRSSSTGDDFPSRAIIGNCRLVPIWPTIPVLPTVWRRDWTRHKHYYMLYMWWIHCWV